MHPHNPLGYEPAPDVLLMNNKLQYEGINVEPGKSYLLRIANVAALASMRFWIEGHTMEIAEVDGVYTKRMPTNMIYLSCPSARSGGARQFHAPPYHCIDSQSIELCKA